MYKLVITFFVLIVLGIGFVLLVKFINISPVGLIRTNLITNSQPNIAVSPHLSLDQVFTSDHTWVKSLPAEKVRILIATGDIIPARSVNYQATSRNDFNWPYLKTADILKGGDVTFVNFETPLIKDCPVTQEGMVFCGDERNLSGLLFAGVDVVNLANNHSANRGIAGIESTTDLMNKAGILVTGVEGPIIKDIKGLKFVFLGYNDIGKEVGISAADEEKIQKEIREAKGMGDVLIVSFHWGTEYVSQPTMRQKELAHLAIDSGADLIIGNHPHWIEPLEIYKNKVITYAHGNFIFDQMWSEKTREGVVGKYTFYDNKLVDVEFLPVRIEDYGQPYFLEAENKRLILEEMERESQILRGEGI